MTSKFVAEECPELRREYLDALRELIAHHRAHGEFVEVERYARRAFEEDPGCEEFYRVVLECEGLYAGSGRDEVFTARHLVAGRGGAALGSTAWG